MSKVKGTAHAHDVGQLETKLSIANKVEGELRKTIGILEETNRKHAAELERLHRAVEDKDLELVKQRQVLITKEAEISRLKILIDAQNRLIAYRGERLAERGY